MPGFDRRFLPERRATLRLPLEKAAAWRDSLFELWEMVRLRPGAALRVNNADVDDNGLKDVLHVHDCSRGHTDAKHCSPLHGWDWGCLFLARMLPEARETDGDALRARLEKEAARLHLTLCPHFSADVLAAKAAEICRNTGRNPASPKPAPDIRSTSGAGEKQAEKTRVRPARYADIGGLDNAVRALREEVELPLRHPEILRHLGIMPSRGCLLHGPPGCGKTFWPEPWPRKAALPSSRSTGLNWWPNGMANPRKNSKTFSRGHGRRNRQLFFSMRLTPLRNPVLPPKVCALTPSLPRSC